MDDVKKQLEEFLTRLFGLIDTQAVQNESHLERMTRVRSPQELALQEALGTGGSPGRYTMLEVLGYEINDVDDHPRRRSVVGTMDYAPDYVLKPQERTLAVLDLKAPDISLDKAVDQICSYCREEKAPLGILFNGQRMHVFINTFDKGLSEYKQFASQPVAVVDRHDLSGMSELLWQFRKSALEANPLKLARRLAKKRCAEEDDRTRQSLVRQKLQALLSDPPDALFAALSALDDVWDGVKGQPSVTDLKAAWSSKETTLAPTVSSTRRTGANPALRDKVAEVCASKGWEAIENAQRSGRLHGLKCRQDGVEEHGYRLVPGRPGVPSGLCVQGRDAPGAMKLIKELETILQGTRPVA